MPYNLGRSNHKGIEEPRHENHCCHPNGPWHPVAQPGLRESGDRRRHRRRGREPAHQQGGSVGRLSPRCDGPLRPRPGPLRHRGAGAAAHHRRLRQAGRDRHDRAGRAGDGLLGHHRQGAQPAGLSPAGRRGAGQDQGLCQWLVHGGAHARGIPRCRQARRGHRATTP